jgi:hypothetical protein
VADALNSVSRRLLCPEARVLFAAIQPDLDPAGAAAALQDPSLDWDALLTLAWQEKAVGALAGLTDRAPEDSIPPTSRTRLAALVRATQFRMLRLQQLLIGALDALAERGIDVVLLKGAGVAATAYGSFAARPMYDVDLLVRQEHVAAAWEALRAAGWVHDAEAYPSEIYEAHHHLPPLLDPLGTGIALELHAALSQTDAIHLPAETIWRSARAIEIHGRRALVPATEHQVLHLAVHFAWSHGLAHASWRTFRDLHQILGRTPVDWDAVVDAARAARATTACYWTFRLARSLAHVTVPPPVLERLRPPRPRLVLDLLERHYIASLYPRNPGPCPSVRLRRLLWTAGMAPRWSGHGAHRPWESEEAWEAVQRNREPQSGGDQPADSSARAARWTGYLRALLAPAHG